MEIPVYLFTGFLESGKTKFIQETLEDRRFNKGERTLLLVCEEGEEEYDPTRFSGKNVFIETLDGIEELTEDALKGFVKKHRASRVVIEYNGMWMIDALYNAMPEEWTIYQEFMFADGRTLINYNANMRQLVVDKLQSCEMLVVNRTMPELDRVEVHKIVRGVNRGADILYEMPDGQVEYDAIEDPPPYDIDAPIVEISDDAYAWWYRDLSEEHDKFEGKTICVRCMAITEGKFPDKTFVFGRQLMTCCVDDIRFAGLAAKYDKIPELTNEGWYMMTAKIENRFSKLYSKRGPVFHVQSMTPTDAPAQPVAAFY